MFFSISQTVEPQFDCYYKIADWCINIDCGWTVQKTTDRLILYKGYCDQMPMSQLVDNISSQHDFTGNFCIISVTAEQVNLAHSQPRSFPLWYKQKKLTNFSPDDESMIQAWADDLLINDNMQDGYFCFKKYNHLSLTQESMALDQVVQQSVNLLIDRACQFKKHFPEKINIYRSGGVDTTLVHALCNHTDIKTLQINNDIVATDFVLKNKSRLNYFWAYQQLHYWNYRSCIATGSHGDEYFLRGPDAIALITAWHDIDFLSLLDQHPESYHYHYFNRESNRNKFQRQYDQRDQLKHQYPTWHDLCSQILNMLVNDHQHWHLGNTMSWTPLKEISIAQWCLNLPIDCLLDHFLNATITKQCIKKLDPSLIESIDCFKNYPYQQKNTKFIS